MLDIYL